MLSPEDRWEIADLLNNYCLVVDNRQLARLDDILTEDVECIFQTGVAKGRDSVRTFIADVQATLTATQHNLTTSVVTEDGDGASGSTYLVVQHIRDGAERGTTFAIGGAYQDQFRREAGGWRIARRKLVGSWRAGNPAVLSRPVPN